MRSDTNNDPACVHACRCACPTTVNQVSAPRRRWDLRPGELLRAALICLPLKGAEVALGYGRLLGAQGPMPEAGNPLS
jgi:hypothetical protein